MPSHSQKLASKIRTWGKSLGFDAIGISDIDLSEAENHLLDWLSQGYEGNMEYMRSYGTRRSRPNELVPSTIRVIAGRMNYLSQNNVQASDELSSDQSNAVVARYALGRDYHKLIRRRLQRLIDEMTKDVDAIALCDGQPMIFRAFADSAPVLEKPLAVKAGLGWIGKHTNLIARDAGSWFFLGEIYTNLPLPIAQPASEHCGSCRRCIDVCPTNAIIAPFKLDATKCIAYHTIELKGSIPEQFRTAIGNRIFGCDDCQIVCPWNSGATLSNEPDFMPRNDLDSSTLVELFNWSEEEFEARSLGTVLRRLGYERWLRNIAVGLGNAPTNAATLIALRGKTNHPSALVREHVAWALEQHTGAPHD